MTRVNLSPGTETPLLARGVFALAAYLIFGFLVPLLVWASILRPSAIFPYVENSVWAVGLSNLAVWYSLGKLRQYARARQLSYVVPINLFFFGIAATVIGLFRLPYSISLLGAGLIGTVAISYVVTAATRRILRTHRVVPAGRAQELLDRQNFEPIASLEEFRKVVESSGKEIAIVADLHYDHEAEWERLFATAALKGIPVYHFRQILELQSGQVRIDHLSENNLGSLIPNLPYMAAKRVFDVSSVILLSPLILLICGIVAILIKLDSEGPILFTQQRTGWRGEPFTMVKFRSMKPRKVSACEEARKQDAMTRDDDDRITRLGRFIRKTRLDELPQAWNILLGDMSWIGPRPEAVELSEWYEGELPFYAYRHIVRPGLTGWAQVNQGHVTDLASVQGKLRYDFYYVKNISLWLDVLIALKTLRVVSGGIGAR